MTYRSLTRSITGDEPITLEEAKLHLRVDASDDDALITSIISAARERLEIRTRRTLIESTWTVTYDRFPAGALELPRPPLVSVTSVAYVAGDGTETAWDAANYVAGTSEPGYLRLAYSKSWPAIRNEWGAVRIVYVAGYPDGIPAMARAAMLLDIAHLYENREAVTVSQGYGAVTVPMGYDALASLLSWGGELG